MAKFKVYAAYDPVSREVKMFDTWSLCESYVKGKPVKYKGFSNKNEAIEWIVEGLSLTQKNDQPQIVESLDKNAVFCDSGKSGENPTEINVTNYVGYKLLHKIPIARNFGTPTDKGFLRLSPDKTNNYGELLAMYLSLIYALNEKLTKIYSDSKIIVDYWSLGHCKIVDKETLELVGKTSALRKEFESLGGKIEWISGDINPADLGNHKPKY